MPRSNLLLAIIVLLAMLGIWYFSSDNKISPVPAEESPPPTEISQRIPSTPTPSPKDLKKGSYNEKLSAELAELKNKLAQETQKLELKKITLDRLYQRQRQLLGYGALSSQIQRRQLDIQDLQDEISLHRQAEDDINRAASQALLNQESQAAVDREQLDTAIQALELEIQNTKNNLTYWRDYASGIDIRFQQDNINRLQESLNEQENRLRQLRTQRINVSENVLRYSETFKNLADRAREELRNLTQDSQIQIYSLRDEMDELQESYSRSQGQLNILNSQIAKAENELQSQSNLIQEIQNSIEIKEKEATTN